MTNHNFCLIYNIKFRNRSKYAGCYENIWTNRHHEKPLKCGFIVSNCENTAKSSICCLGLVMCHWHLIFGPTRVNLISTYSSVKSTMLLDTIYICFYADFCGSHCNLNRCIHFNALPMFACFGRRHTFWPNDIRSEECLRWASLLFPKQKTTAS